MKNAMKLFGCIWPMIAAYLCQVVVSAIGMAVYTVVIFFGAASQEIENKEELMDYTMEAMRNGTAILLIGGIAVAATLLLGAVWYKKYCPRENRTWKQIWNSKLLAGMVLMGIALQLMISMCLNVIYPLLPKSTVSEYSELMETLIGGNAVISIIVTVILAPVAEELLFRGVTLQKAKKIMPFLWANILQALMFGVYHGNWIQGIYAFFLGMLLGYVAEQFHSIWASVLLHACVNGSAQLLSLIPEKVTERMMGILVLALVGVLFLVLAGKLLKIAKTELPELVYPKKPEEFIENSFDEYNV